MIYTEEMRASQARVEATRNIRLSEELPRFTAEEKGNSCASIIRITMKKALPS